MAMPASPPSKWQRLPTEAINPLSREIDTLSEDEIVEVMILDNRNVLAAVKREKPRIARAARMIATTVLNGGRLIFVGAGTSGRLGVLEAAELPPTFGIPPDRAIAIMAGGPPAVHKAKEGVEDDRDAGDRMVRRLRPNRKDTVIGISASGITPFVRSAVRARACRTRRRHRHHLRSAIRIEGSLRCRDCADRRTGGHCRLDEAQGGHRDQGRTEYAHDHGDGPRRKDLRQSDGRCKVQLGEAARSRMPHHHDSHGARPCNGGDAAGSIRVECESGDSDAANRRDARGGAFTSSRRTPTSEASRPPLNPESRRRSGAVAGTKQDDRSRFGR